MRTFGLIGYPLSHSFSAKWFAEKFSRENITDCEYLNFPIEDLQSFPQLIAESTELCGLNVTIPHKEHILPYLHRLDSTAEKIGAVNCIRIEKDRSLSGFNTDAFGFETSILPFLENRFERALILGTGGSSKAVEYVLTGRGIDVWKVSTSRTGPRFLRYEDLDASALAHFKLIVNCTPLGMAPNVDQRPPLPYGGIGPEHFLYDLVYNPEITAFLQEGINSGAQTMNGYRMLIGQAEKSWAIWNENGAL